ncbi:transcription factor bHLH94-like [Triticum dicoccoides]|uniref:BHLH domain-containing protein n=1 Tax=Triticum turgidum subsp. durum TaxID=4567 RepID=A0A9R0YQ51_TRITD|nr:transcription factor bHLH94-like [Triticum dicoccoides]VAI59598.1 unnamed protein product [Triticum turgidum subsp. durum]
MALVDALCASSVDNAALVYSTFNAAGFLFDNAAGFYDGTGIADGPALALQAADRAPGLSAAGDVAPCLEKQSTSSPAPPRRKRRRRARSCKSREETECQRMTHIAVERNRRRQMNEYLVVLRSLMPESYVQRGDQASIVGGAIDFVKELEQQLQSLEAQKRTLAHYQQHKAGCDATPLPAAMPTRASTSGGNACVESTSNCSSSVTEADGASDAPPFAGFFTYPQYVWRQSPRDATTLSADESRAGVADIEVNLVETHASLRVMAPRRPGQLLRMVAGLQALRLTVLHLNVTALDSLLLYSLSLKVEEGCGLTTADDIAAAVHHVLCFIHAEAGAASQQLLAPAQ